MSKRVILVQVHEALTDEIFLVLLVQRQEIAHDVANAVYAAPQLFHEPRQPSKEQLGSVVRTGKTEKTRLRSFASPKHDLHLNEFHQKFLLLLLLQLPLVLLESVIKENEMNSDWNARRKIKRLQKR